MNSRPLTVIEQPIASPQYSRQERAARKANAKRLKQAKERANNLINLRSKTVRKEQPVSSVRLVSLAQFQDECRAQEVSKQQHFAFKCPICGTIQSGADLIKGGVGIDFPSVEPVLGFSCVGRFTKAGPWKKDEPPGRGCDWTLGGFFSLHKMAIVMPDGKTHPIFELATPEEAQQHEAANA